LPEREERENKKQKSFKKRTKKFLIKEKYGLKNYKYLELKNF